MNPYSVSQFKSWYARQPSFTRTYLSIGIVISLLLSLKVISSQLIITDYSTTFKLFQIWRPFTAITTMGKISFFFIFRIMIAYFALTRVQNQIFNKERFADFLWLFVYLFIGLTIFACFIPLYITNDSFIYAMIYIWCKRRPFETLTLMFGFKCRSGYFPWVFMGFNILMGASIWAYVAALPLAHFYIIVKDIFAPKYHKDFLATPKFFEKLMNRNQRAFDNIHQRDINIERVFHGRAVRID